ncbi:hypothetical protein BC832DRAFT_449676 [Gaertneriomyces semiglobifer]|nr:hypothetical protein BC832DRAFT_449676 [Gaertneriomyces semiglobifer]
MGGDGMIYKVMVAVNNTPQSYKALDTAVNLCKKLKVEYKLYIVYFVALNPKQSIPYIDHLERAYNMEIQSNAEVDVQQCKQHLSELYSGKVNYEFVEVEGEGETGPLIEEVRAHSYCSNDVAVNHLPPL